MGQASMKSESMVSVRTEPVSAREPSRLVRFQLTI